MTHDLRDVPAEVDPRVVPLTVGAPELMPVAPARLPARAPGLRVRQRRPTRSARCSPASVVGPLLACSRMAVVDGRVAGAAIVNAFPGEPPTAGPWLAELFRDPAYPGIGRALLRGALDRRGRRRPAGARPGRLGRQPGRGALPRRGLRDACARTSAWISARLSRRAVSSASMSIRSCGRPEQHPSSRSSRLDECRQALSMPSRSIYNCSSSHRPVVGRLRTALTSRSRLPSSITRQRI